MKNFSKKILCFATLAFLMLVSGEQYANSFFDDNLGVEFCYALPQDVMINEINYRSPGVQQNIDFIELYNNGTTPVDLSGWSFTQGVNYSFPPGISIGAGEYLVIASNPNTVQSTFGINGVLGPYEGSLNSEKEEIFLRDNNFLIIDEVEYEDWAEWPSVRYLNDGDSPVSIQKINPTLNSKHPGSWKGEVPSPGAANTAVLINNADNIPVVKSVRKSPDKPMSNETVRIRVDMANLDNIVNDLTINLEYQQVVAGSYISKSSPNYNSSWVTIEMTDDGMGPDSTANNGVYTAEIPSNIQTHRSLIRYRINVKTSNGFDRYFPDPNHTEDNYGYYVYDGHVDFNGFSFADLNPMQELVIITSQNHANTYIGNGVNNSGQYPGREYLGEGTLVYNGKVYDHIRFRPRGKDSRSLRIKPGIKIDMNAEHSFETENDCGKEYKVKRKKLVLSGTWVNDKAAHGLTESLNYKILDLVGGLARYADYTSLRIVDNVTEAGNQGDFWGIYLFLEDFGGDMWEEHKLGDGNLWSYKPTILDYLGDFPNSSTLGNWAISTASTDTSFFFGDYIANEIWANGEANYVGKHSYREYYNPDKGLWHGWCADYDGSYGMPNNTPAVAPRSSSNVNQAQTPPIPIPSNLRILYEGAFRSAYDLLLNDEQSNFLVDSESNKIYRPNAAVDWVTLDKSRWNQTYDLGNVDAQVDWYRNWFTTRAEVILTNTTFGIADSDIPAKPTIQLTGSFAINDLTLSTSSFSDPQGAASFEAMEWRVGEWSDPNNSFYDNICEPIYEIQEKWKSGEITTFSNSYTIPYSADLEAGRTYKIRVRYKDNTGRWSHWSDPVSFVAEVADNPTAPNIVINEILYNETDCGAQFIELKNADNFSIDISEFSFVDGIEYTFPPETYLNAGQSIVLAKDAADFNLKYGFAPFDEYSGSLDNNGERLELRGWFGAIADSLTYNDKNPWDENPSDNPSSLELLDVTLDNNNPLSWFRSDLDCGTPGAENTRTCSNNAVPIVINEINYNSNNDLADPGDWVEIYNSGQNVIDLSGWTFYDNGGAFILPQGTVIAPDGYLVLVENEDMFNTVFPNVPNYQSIGDWDFSLSNKGERISLFDENKCLSDYVIYDDKAPWPETPDGDGPTLSLLDPNLDNNESNSWASSTEMTSDHYVGSPGESNLCTPFQPCDDGDVCTVGETYDANCNCSGGVYQDADNDNFCDAEDVCPNFDDGLIGTPCDDGDICTTGETYDINCGCSGGVFQDIDNDGICDPLDDCDNNLEGTPCDDGDICTAGETYDANCNCTGGVFQDIDSDGVCDAEDVCPELDNNLLGQLCDDGDPLTDFDTYNTNTCSCSGIVVVETICSRVSASEDDAEEQVLNGTVTLTSGDLDMVNDEGVVFIAGMRFQNINIEQGKTIESAFIQFAADEANAQVTSLTIKGEAIDNAPVFEATVNNISNKVLTDTSVIWEPDPWVAPGDASPVQKTVDIGPVIQEIINRPGFVSGNAISIIIEGTGIRTAESFDGSAVLAPELCITFSNDNCVENYPCDDGDPNTINDAYDENCDCVGEDILINAKILLEGFYDNQNNNMHTSLKDKGLLPLNQPFNTAPWNYAGDESVSSIPEDVVDWILLITRDGNGDVLDQAAGFVTQSGEIMNINGTMGIPIPTGMGNHFSIHQRSHLAVLSASVYNGGMYDFTTSDNQAAGNGQLKMIDGKFMLYGGDYDGTGIINNNDFNDWKIQSAAINQYLPIDGDGNGIINSLDYNIWTINKSKIGHPDIRY